ncbi:MAG: transglycosylase SLT domain-containing protein [Bdellovibrio sp.]
MKHSSSSFLKLFLLVTVVVGSVDGNVYAETASATSLATQQLIYENYVNNVLRQQDAAAAQLALEQQQVAKNAQMGAMLQVFFKYCPLTNTQTTAMGKKGQDLRDEARNIDDVMWDERSKAGNIYDDSMIDHDTALEVGHDIDANMQTGCTQFMDNQGRMGPWGSWALQMIKNKPDSFGENVPDDIRKWCPNYPKMKPAQRELFWVWAMMSMASSESSCNPKADNKNAPNGTAIGLFQLEYNKCPKAAKRTDDLHNPKHNITCAVDLLSNELQNRDDLMTPTSKGSKGTYWGPLRSDDWNKARGGDISGAQKTRSIMKKYRYCQGSDVGSGVVQTQSKAKGSR